MYLKSLSLTHYRNYVKTNITFEDKVNVILGENAQGKTNMMEAIYVLALAKSHRTHKDKELIQWDEDFAKIKAEVVKRTGSLELEIIISNKGKKVKLNGLEQQKLSDYIGACNVVMFAPEDLHLVKGGPKERRRFIDMEIGQVSSLYLQELNVYQKILQQRNQLLKSMQKKKTETQELTLEVITSQLVTAGAKVVAKRFRFLSMLEEWAKNIHYDISRGREILSLHYKPSVNVSDDADLSKIERDYYEAIHDLQRKEIERGVTLVGPHRDDIVFFINNRNVQVYGSQGQQRTTALSLKLAEIELIKNKVGEYPILLLDDVLSELDDFRQSHLLNTIQGKVQTFVTTTSVTGIDHETLHKANTLSVENGSLQTSS